MDHIDKNILEKLYVMPEAVEADLKTSVGTHLEICSYCREQYEQIGKIYTEIQKEGSTEPSARDSAFAERLVSRKTLALPFGKHRLPPAPVHALDTYVEVIEPYRGPLPQRIIRYTRRHPVGVTAGFSMAAALVVLAILSVNPFRDTNPAYARAKDEFLVAYNKDGTELWRKHMGPNFDAERISHNANIANQPDDYIQVADVDADGSNEVTAVFGRNVWSEWEQGVFCFDFRGKQKWSFVLHGPEKFGEEHLSDIYHFYKLMVADLDRDGIPEIIVFANHTTHYPSALVSLDGRTGKKIQEYWNSGSIRGFQIADVDGDGNKEIVIACENNAFDLAALAVLDATRFSGHAPASAAYTPSGVPEGIEKYYLLFPKCDLNDFEGAKRNIVSGIQVQRDNIMYVSVSVNFYKNGKFEAFPLLYFFNQKMECFKVEGQDVFVKMHEQLYAEGKLKRELDAQYYEELRNGIQYWDGEKFVNKPVMNRKYIEAARDSYVMNTGK